MVVCLFVFVRCSISSFSIFFNQVAYQLLIYLLFKVILILTRTLCFSQGTLPFQVSRLFAETKQNTRNITFKGLMVQQAFHNYLPKMSVTVITRMTLSIPFFKCVEHMIADHTLARSGRNGAHSYRKQKHMDPRKCGYDDLVFHTPPLVKMLKT